MNQAVEPMTPLPLSERLRAFADDLAERGLLGPTLVLEAADTLSAQEKAMGEMREALRPFAESAADLCEDTADDHPMRSVYWTFKAGQLRKAKAAYEAALKGSPA